MKLRIIFLVQTGLLFVLVGCGGPSHIVDEFEPFPDIPNETSYSLSWSPDSGQLVFEDDFEGNFEIYLVDVETQSFKNLTKNFLNDSGSSWSPDSKQIVFVSDRKGTKDIYVINVQSESLTQLISIPEDIYVPNWSPDGEHILAKAYTENGDVYLFHVQLDGLESKQITKQNLYYLSLRWAPDSETILFRANPNNMFINYFGTPIEDELYSMKIDGSGLSRLTDNNSVEWLPSWSPDGKHILFASNPENNHTNLYMMDADGGNLINITKRASRDYWPSWSPDASHIVFTSMQDGNEEIYIITPDGSEETRLTNTPDVHEFAPLWSPDGTTIAFWAYKDGDPDRRLYVMDIDGSNRQLLVTVPN